MARRSLGRDADLVKRLPPLPQAAGLVAALILAVADASVLFESFGSPRQSDFINFYSAARLGLSHGWPAIYDTPRLLSTEQAAGGHVMSAFPYPPPAAWVALPFTALPFPAAADLASLAFLVLVLLACWWATEGLRGRVRLSLLVAAVGFFPLALVVGIGQLTALTMAVLSGAAALLRRARPGGAGATLGLLVVKPHLGILSLPALGLAGRWKSALIAVGVIASLAILSFVAVGSTGARAMLQAATGYGVRSAFSFGTIPVSLPPLAALPAIVATIALTALICWWSRPLGADLAIASGTVAGLMVFPHELIYDYSLLLLAGLLLLRNSQMSAIIAVLVASYALLELSNLFLVWWGFPIVLPVEAALLLAMAWTAWASRQRRYSNS